jgi:IS30 family transposase
MEQARQRGLTAAQKADLWWRWKEGQTLTEIGLALGKHAASIQGVLLVRGGIAPRARTRSRLALTLVEREEISRGIARGDSARSIARALGRPASTVCRELARHRGRRFYRAADADLESLKSARRPKECKLALCDRLRWYVARRLRMRWSPEQVAGRLRRDFPDDPSMHVSHETIYKSLFVQARGVLKKELLDHLRSRRILRRAKCATTKGQPRAQIRDAVPINERPAEAADRAVPGHWEGDMLSGANNSHIATLVERCSRFTMLVKLPGKVAPTVRGALARHVQRLPKELLRSLTWDRGSEMAEHREFTVATDVKVYFCDPRSPWQRGTNENTNRLLRQYFPKGTDLSRLSQTKLDRVAFELNQRPRKTLGYETPADRMNARVALTG